MNLDPSSALILVGFGATIIFNAGVQWAFISMLRKDMNGFKTYLRDHEEWANKQVNGFQERVSKLEGRREMP